MRRERLDKLLVDRGLVPSRERARALILAGDVRVRGEIVRKAGELVSDDAPISLARASESYVSRGGTKLAGPLDAMGVGVQGKTCMDVGASTGGFTDVLLQRGARKVYAVDVGYGQLAWALRQDPRVVVVERQNARHLSPGVIPEPIELAVVDVSFISLSLVLPAVRSVLGPAGEVVALVKPQFEAGRGQTKRGVVRDEGVRLAAIDRIRVVLSDLGFELRGEAPAALPGPKGNREHFLYARLREPVHEGAKGG